MCFIITRSTAEWILKLDTGFKVFKDFSSCMPQDSELNPMRHLQNHVENINTKMYTLTFHILSDQLSVNNQVFYGKLQFGVNENYNLVLF